MNNTQKKLTKKNQQFQCRLPSFTEHRPPEESK